MTNIQQRLDIALQKAHFGDYEIAIRQLIEVIREQQEVIEETKALNNMRSALADFIKQNYNIERKQEINNG